TFLIGTYTFSTATSYTIVGTTSLPNGAADGNAANDSYTVTKQTALSGNYNVGAGGDFSTLTAAVTAANTNGLCGPTTFLLTDALYSASETFPIIINSGATAANTLTIKPGTGVNATISGSVTGTLLKVLDSY